MFLLASLLLIRNPRIGYKPIPYYPDFNDDEEEIDEEKFMELVFDLLSQEGLPEESIEAVANKGFWKKVWKKVKQAAQWAWDRRDQIAELFTSEKNEDEEEEEDPEMMEFLFELLSQADIPVDEVSNKGFWKKVWSGIKKAAKWAWDRKDQIAEIITSEENEDDEEEDPEMEEFLLALLSEAGIPIEEVTNGWFKKAWKKIKQAAQWAWDRKDQIAALFQKEEQANKGFWKKVFGGVKQAVKWGWDHKEQIAGLFKEENVLDFDLLVEELPRFPWQRKPTQKQLDKYHKCKEEEKKSGKVGLFESKCHLPRYM